MEAFLGEDQQTLGLWVRRMGIWGDDTFAL